MQHFNFALANSNSPHIRSLTAENMVVQEPLFLEPHSADSVQDVRSLNEALTEDQAISTLSILAARSRMMSKLRARLLNETGFNLGDMHLHPLAIESSASKQAPGAQVEVQPEADKLNVTPLGTKLNWSKVGQRDESCGYIFSECSI